MPIFDYQLLKIIHILSSTFLWGTGVGTAFFMFMAHVSQDTATIQRTTKHVVMADWLFTTPAFIIQPISGYFLMKTLNYSFESQWFLVVAGLYGIMAIAWFPVVYLQDQMRRSTQHLDANAALPERYHFLFVRWISLGFPAAIAVISLFVLMVYKPWLI